MQKIKVCCYCEKWESGGIESLLHNVYSRLDLHDFELHIAAAEIKKSLFTEKLTRHGVVFHELSGSRKNLFKNYSLFIRLLKKERYDIVHLNLYHAISLFYLYLAKHLGVTMRIAHSHNTALKRNAAYFLRIFIHCAARALFSDCATSFWACSEMAARFAFSSAALSKKGYTFIPNGIETERFVFDESIRESIRNRLGLAEKLVLGNVGRLSYQKNQAFLVDILHEAVRQNPACCLLLVGEGEAKELLEEKVRKLGLHDSVLFYGNSNHVEELLWAMDLFVFPSRFEGLPIAALEAQAAGLPVICSDDIPGEIHATPSTYALPLEAGAEAWAEHILSCPIPSHDQRRQNCEHLKEAGFDLSNTVRMIEVGYKAKSAQ